MLLELKKRLWALKSKKEEFNPRASLNEYHTFLLPALVLTVAVHYIYGVSTNQFFKDAIQPQSAGTDNLEAHRGKGRDATRKEEQARKKRKYAPAGAAAAATAAPVSASSDRIAAALERQTQVDGLKFLIEITEEGEEKESLKRQLRELLTPPAKSPLLALMQFSRTPARPVNFEDDSDGEANDQDDEKGDDVVDSGCDEGDD